MTQLEAARYLVENKEQLYTDIQAKVPQASKAMIAAIIFSESPDMQGAEHTINHHLYFTDAVKEYKLYVEARSTI